MIFFLHHHTTHRWWCFIYLFSQKYSPPPYSSSPCSFCLCIGISITSKSSRRGSSGVGSRWNNNNEKYIQTEKIESKKKKRRVFWKRWEKILLGVAATAVVAVKIQHFYTHFYFWARFLNVKCYMQKMDNFY